MSTAHRPHTARRTLGTVTLLTALLITAGTPATALAAEPAAPTARPAAPAVDAGEVLTARPVALPRTTTVELTVVEPGGTVTSVPVTASSVASRAWRIEYRTTTVTGAPTTASGTVIVPTAAYSGGAVRPIVAYAPGTQGWGDDCAPSASMPAGAFDEQFAVDNLLKKGWAVVVTDYPGLGTSGTHQYNVGVAAGRAVLDALRAAAGLPDAGLSPSAPMAIEGYSQGGGAAGWAAQLHPTYAPELNLVGVATGGPPANLQAVSRNINGTLFFAFLAGTAVGFDAAYPEVGLGEDLTETGRAAVADLATLCQVPALLKYAGKRIEDYTVGGVNPIGEPVWQKVLNANNLGGVRPAAPVLLYHGWFDEIIPWSVADTLHGQWCGRGANVTLQGFLAEHVLTQVFNQDNIVTWLADRLTGKPTTPTC